MATPDLPTVVDPYTGETRVLGSLPSDPRLVSSLPPYVGEVLPASELKAFNDFPAHIKIKDQDGRGACNGFATAGAVEQTRFVQGMDHAELSGWYPYAILCNGVDRGSNILQAYRLAGEKGIAPESEVAYGTINPRQLTPEAHAAAKRFRGEAGNTYQSWRQVVSAVMLRENMNLSVCVGQRFSTLDPEGVAGVDRGPGNHAVCVGLGLRKSARWGWLVLMRNSWSEKWGQKGFCWLAEAHIEAGTYFECFGVMGVHDDVADLENPPPVKAPMLADLPKKSTWKPRGALA